MCTLCVRLGAYVVRATVCGYCVNVFVWGVCVLAYTHMRVYNKMADTVLGIFVSKAVIFALGIIIKRLS